MKNSKKEGGQSSEKIEVPKEKLTLDDLIKDHSEENIRRYVALFFEEMEAENPECGAVLDARPGLDRRKLLADLLVRSLQIRFEELGDLYEVGSVNIQELKGSLKEIFLAHIKFMKRIDECLRGSLE